MRLVHLVACKFCFQPLQPVRSLDLSCASLIVLQPVGGDEGPVSGVAQVVSHGVKVVGVHGEKGMEEDGEVRGEVKGEVEENQGQPLMCMA